MLGNNRMNTDQVNRCVKHYSFLSPRSTSPFSNYSQKTVCDLSSASSNTSSTHEERSQISSIPSKDSFSLWKLFSPWRASCETNQPTPTATDRMERAKESLKQMDATRSGIVISEMEIQNYLAKETGKDRLIKMFAKDHMGQWSPEAKFMYQVTVQSAGGTFLVMATLAGRQAKQDFIERNRATVFKTRFQAFRRMQDAIFLFSMKEGAKWALRVSLFSAAFLGISQSIAVYRNKSSAWEYGAGAGITMGLLKVNMGLKACVVSTGLGIVMGCFMGFVAMGAMTALNETQEQRHYWQIQKELEREKLFQLKGKLPDVPAVETA
ncbi:complex I assembly factor TIMMDC1, mitochondrial-like [Babylonia areolata]|uniref:complex I assembly factor TIMMDC1, mitochondrial-like n=1 Tax=Babylonia areolata TaxID=304850 RepID=UPI003FD223B4